MGGEHASCSHETRVVYLKEWMDSLRAVDIGWRGSGWRLYGVGRLGKSDYGVEGG